MKNKFSAIVLLCDSHHGQYLPMMWATHADTTLFNVKPEDSDILKDGPEHDLYWETWDDVLSYARYTDEAGNEFSLYQDGDLWAICYDKMTDAERANFGFDE